MTLHDAATTKDGGQNEKLIRIFEVRHLIFNTPAVDSQQYELWRLLGWNYSEEYDAPKWDSLSSICGGGSSTALEWPRLQQLTRPGPSCRAPKGSCAEARIHRK